MCSKVNNQRQVMRRFKNLLSKDVRARLCKAFVPPFFNTAALSGIFVEYAIVTNWNYLTNIRKPRRDFRLQTSYFRLHTSYFILQTSDFRLHTSDFRLQTSDFRLHTSYFRLHTSYFILQTSDFRLSLAKFELRISHF